MRFRDIAERYIDIVWFPAWRIVAFATSSCTSRHCVARIRRRPGGSQESGAASTRRAGWACAAAGVRMRNRPLGQWRRSSALSTSLGRRPGWGCRTPRHTAPGQFPWLRAFLARPRAAGERHRDRAALQSATDCSVAGSEFDCLGPGSLSNSRHRGRCNHHCERISSRSSRTVDESAPSRTSARRRSTSAASASRTVASCALTRSLRRLTRACA